VSDRNLTCHKDYNEDDGNVQKDDKDEGLPHIIKYYKDVKDENNK
jgi:hypothetical protein